MIAGKTYIGGEVRSCVFREKCTGMRVLVAGTAGFLGSHLADESLPVDDPVRRHPDITRARTLLGLEPKLPLAEGLARALEYFKQQPGAEQKEPG
jgi:nucleoside-diphosphate-sugar epimerase